MTNVKDCTLQERDLHARIAKEKCIHLLKIMLICRAVDDKMGKLVRQNKGTAFHLSPNGHELIGAASALALIPEKDWGLPYYRDRSFALGLGCSAEEILAAFLARKARHHSGGRMMPDHFCHRRLNIPCQSSVVGSQFLQAVGIAKAAKLKGQREVVYVSGGDGSTSQGDFHEALNYASIHQLGVLFVIQDNQWAISVPIQEQTAGSSIAQMISGYDGLMVHKIDGCDYEEVSKALSMATAKARAFDGPSVIVAQVPRLGPHSSSDDPKKYRQECDLDADKKHDPIPRYEKWLLEMGLITEENLEEIRAETRAEVGEAARKAEAYPLPNPDTVLDHLFLPYSPSIIPPTEREEGGESIVIMDALNHAIDEEMARDEKVIVFGQDVAHGKGGVFGITRNLSAKYGAERCFNTPLAESTIIGSAIGLSVHSDFKPVIEVQFADYIWTGMNQLFNELASYHYRSNGEWHCPIVIRVPYGGYIQGGPYHSQSIEAFLCHCPGLKVVVPSHAADAKRLLKTAIRDPNPVIFLEHKALYRQRVFSARIEPTAEELLPFGKASIVREGQALTVVCWGFMVPMVVEIATKLEAEGIDTEIIDLRSLHPLDSNAILQSVEKTSKLLIVHEAPLHGGFGAEIAAQVSDQGFGVLDAPVMRLGGLSTCVPYAKNLEEKVLPQKNDIETAIRKLATY